MVLAEREEVLVSGVVAVGWEFAGWEVLVGRFGGGGGDVSA